MLSSPLQAQEFNCEVSLNYDQLETANLQYLDNLKNEIQNYINEYEWTDVDFEEHERIQCQLRIILTSHNGGSVFGGQAIFTSRRPVYNTTAQTTNFLYSDDTWQFDYSRGRSLIHDELQFEALTGFIDFFCFIMLGFDFDSFSELGGTPYFNEAQNVLSLAQSTSAIGWSRNTNNRRNRATMITDLLSTNYESFRSAYYRYHRKALDTFVDEPEDARQEMLSVLAAIQDSKRRSTSNYIYDLFFDTKASEITSFFTDAQTSVRLEAYNILRETDQSHLSEYESLQ
ncbi:MAG: DUF4835 family protein [Balneolaceae bacterium]|nr:DUF4835 family protein [Balneolaceae bacterium]